MKKINEYKTFIEWSAMPSSLRKPATQKELAKRLKVDAATLSDWKQEPTFWGDVNQQLQAWSKGRTPDVIQALYENIIKTGNPSAVKLWLDAFEPSIKTEPQTISPVLVRFVGDDEEYESISEMNEAKLRKLAKQPIQTSSELP